MNEMIVVWFGLLSAATAQTNIDLTSADFNASYIGNNSLFTTWRPTYHFMAPNSWQNDPCGPVYDPQRQKYVLAYQTHPGHIMWGNISWKLATSDDMAVWYDSEPWNSTVPAIGTMSSGDNTTYNNLGIFTGSVQPIDINGSQGGLLAFYTSVRHLPTSFSAYYIPGTESQSLAMSSDGGATWTEYDNNPIIDGPPDHLNITGFRDPFYHQWPEMDAILYGNGTNMQEHWYATISSGIKGVGPRLQFYQALANDLTNWTYLGPLFAASANESFSEKWSGSYGYNFEVAGAFSLMESEEEGGDGETVHQFVTVGTEGGNTYRHNNSHWTLWASGPIMKTDNGSAELTPAMSGVGDWGTTYAQLSFNDTKNDRRIIWGWVPESINQEEAGLLKAQGWQGTMILPRHLFVQVMRNVVNTMNGNLTSPSSWTATEDGDGSYTVKTLGTRPASDAVEALRNGSNMTEMGDMTISPGIHSLGVNASNFELRTEIPMSGNSTVAGFVIRHSPDKEEHTNHFLRSL